MYNIINSLKPYFYSLREINEDVSLDIKIPITWAYTNVVISELNVRKIVQDKNDKFLLLSLVTNSTSEGYDTVYKTALEIIKINKEEEEKQKLFNEKINELKELFKNESLDKLKNIDILKKDGEKIETGSELVKKRNGKRSIGDTNIQIENN